MVPNKTNPIPEGLQNIENNASLETKTAIRTNSGIPPGYECFNLTTPGGVASLNHRLITVVPPGQIRITI